MRSWAVLIVAVWMITACASSPERRAAPAANNAIAVGQPAAWVADAVAGDGPGWRRPSASPKPVTVANLPKSRRGNPTQYSVGGVRYTVLDSAEGFVEQGYASWYGKKFHGRETSSGERYDMYDLTAAHKSLPLPTFVRVTRTDNGESIVVKVNDRGPFVPGRIIDLSYQAASTLGIVKDGTAPVIVEALSTHQVPSTTTSAAVEQNRNPVIKSAASSRAPATLAAAEPVNRPVSGQYVQVGAFGLPSNAQNLREILAGVVAMPIVVNHDQIQSLYRVWVGPIQSIAERDYALAALQSKGVKNFTMVTLLP